MAHSISTSSTPSNEIHSNSSPSVYSEVIYWFFIAALAGAASIVLHELAHYITAILVGASDVTFHWAYVDHDPSSVSAVDNALIAFLGPLSSYSIAAAAWWYGRKTISVSLLALGFSAAFRNLAVLPYTIKTVLGRDTSTFFFDEIRGASTIGISPFIPVLISLTVGILGTVYFSRKAKHEKSTILMVVMIVGAFAGAYAWSIFGAMIFPGGHGFN